MRCNDNSVLTIRYLRLVCLRSIEKKNRTLKILAVDPKWWVDYMDTTNNNDMGILVATVREGAGDYRESEEDTYMTWM